MLILRDYVNMYNLASERQHIAEINDTIWWLLMSNCCYVTYLSQTHNFLRVPVKTSLTSRKAFNCHLYPSQRHAMRWLQPLGFPQSFARKRRDFGPIVWAEAEDSTNQRQTTQTTGRCDVRRRSGCAEVEVISPGSGKLFICLRLKVDAVLSLVIYLQL